MFLSCLLALVRCILRVRDQAQRAANSLQTQELQYKMYISSGSYVTVFLVLFFCVSHPVVCMYGTVGVVFVSFLLRSSFQYFLVAVNYNVAVNRECIFKDGFSRCSECFQPRFFRRICEQCILQVKISAPGALFFLGTTIPRSSRPQS